MKLINLQDLHDVDGGQELPYGEGPWCSDEPHPPGYATIYCGDLSGGGYQY